MAAEQTQTAAEVPVVEEVVVKAAEETAEVAVVETVEKGDDCNADADADVVKEKEETVDPEKKALDELKELIVAALAAHEFSKPAPVPAPVKAVVDEEKKEEDQTAKTETVAEEVEKEKPGEEVAVEAKAVQLEKLETPEKEAEPKVSVPLSVALAEEEKKDSGPAAEEKKESAPAAAEEKETAPVGEECKEKGEGEEDNSVPAVPEEVFIWGIPLIGGGEKSDTLLKKFLVARDFKVKETLAMIKNTVIWRKEFGIESLLTEDLGVPELERVVFSDGFDKEGHPVCYNVYGEFQGKDLYQKVFGDEEKRKNFLRWRVQLLEKQIREKLDFSSNGVSTMVQVTDLKNSPGPAKKELRQATRQALSILQDNYPEFVATQVFINVPWWYLAFNRMIAPLFTPRTKSKFVFSGPSKSADTLFKYIAPEQVPVKYGGLSCVEKDTVFSTGDAVTDVCIKPSTTHTIEIPVTEPCTLFWELRVLGWDVSYGAEFTPAAEGGYTVIIQKNWKFISTDEPVVKNSFKIGEAGKVVLKLDNTTSKKKKKLLYRSKIITKSCSTD